MRSGEAAGGSYSTHIPAHILVNRFAYTPFTITKFFGVISNIRVRSLCEYHYNQTIFSYIFLQENKNCTGIVQDIAEVYLCYIVQKVRKLIPYRNFMLVSNM